MGDLKKTIDLGLADYTHSGRKRNKVTVDVKLIDGNLSMVGHIWNAKYTDEEALGQIADVLPGLFPGNAKVARMAEVWERWHQNDMRAGCEHQRAEGWHQRPIDPSKPLNAYGRHYPGQHPETWNMLVWVRRTEHPEGLLMEPCDVCGHRYGSRWLKEELPAEIISEIDSW